MADCDVAVVGAGIIGAAVAYELATRGVAVTLLDARGSGLGSTQAAAGMLVPYIEGLGRPLLPMAAKSLRMYDDFVDRVARDSGIGVGYARTGSMQVASSDDGIEELHAIALSMQGAGVKCDLLDGAGAIAAEPHLTPEVRAGLLIHDHGFVVAAELVGALCAAVIKHGARVVVPARVRRIAAAEGAIDVVLETGDRLTALQAVIAAGCWAGDIDLDGLPRLPVRPVRGQLLQLAWDAPPLRRIVWGPDCYLVPAAPSAVIVGATVEDAGFDERTTVAGVRDLLDAATDIVPHVWQAGFTAARVGLRPATPDGLPIIGRSKRNTRVVFATGHFRNGILLAPLTAKAVADLVLENREDPLLTSASPQRFGEY